MFLLHLNKYLIPHPHVEDKRRSSMPSVKGENNSDEECGDDGEDNDRANMPPPRRDADPVRLSILDITWFKRTCYRHRPNLGYV